MKQKVQQELDTIVEGIVSTNFFRRKTLFIRNLSVDFDPCLQILTFETVLSTYCLQIRMKNRE